LLLVLFTPAAPAQEIRLEPAVLAAAARLVEGVGNGSLDGIPGTLGVNGPKVFPLIRDARGNDIAAVLADGRSRAVLLTHDSWFKQASWKDPATERLLSNALGWLLEGRQTARVLCFGTGDLAKRLRAAGHSVDTPTAFPASLAGYDAVCCYFPRSLDHKFNAESAALLAGALAAGTPLLGSGIGWVYQSYGDGLKGGDIASDYAANRVLAGRGLEYLPGSGSGATRPVPPLADGHRVATALAGTLATLRAPAPAHPPAGAETAVDWEAELVARLETVPDWTEVIGAAGLADTANLLAHPGLVRVPSAAAPVLRDDRRTRSAIILAEILSRRHPELFGWLFAAIGEFPGLAPGQALAGQKTSARMDIPRRQTLGIYVNAGSRITLRVEGLPDGASLPLRLGPTATSSIPPGCRSGNAGPGSAKSTRSAMARPASSPAAPDRSMPSKAAPPPPRLRPARPPSSSSTAPFPCRYSAWATTPPPSAPCWRIQPAP
jgi:hypothetical protein